ncbi:hypothetical protein SAMN04487881_2179 [Marinobacter sp. es.048]|uniref:hypothetical protein n=1 Tax=Marinobacter sp. es.048 TaxID=1761795 RepID=UPI000B589088|nr:hypothetical protein [Marinobacter sp. es.048]SNC68115.1 hypothetical protein SAMN04487881_2179 [Marinobacter sp. es.048]
MVNDDKEITQVYRKECLLDLDIPKHAMLPGGGYVKHIMMRMPHLDVVGQPSSFKTLNEGVLPRSN